MSKTNKLALYLLFIASGATSLIYQSLWVRLLSLTVGSTSASISLVLAIFFFGLALGSFLAGRLSSRIQRPVLLYGMIEFGIGIYSVALVYIFLNLHAVLSLVPHQGEWAFVGTITKFGIVSLLLLPPTIGMGASLPILIRVFQAGAGSVGKKVSVLYFVNTLGAVIGAAGGSFILIPTLGVVISNHLAAVANVAILVAAWSLDKSIPTASRAGTTEKQTESRAWTWRKSTRTQSVVFLAVFATGFSSIAAEVVWNKYLGIFFGTNIYGLGIILSIFLAGIAFGSLAMSRFIDKNVSKESMFLALLVGAVLTLIGASHALSYLPLAANIVAYYSAGAINLLTIKSLLSAMVIFPPTLIFGALFPLAIHLLTTSAKDAPAVVGFAYAINTVGAILGSYMAGMVFIPIFGSSVTISIAVCLLALVTAFAFLVNATKKVTAYSGVAVVIAIAITTAVVGNIEFRNIIKSAYFQTLQPSLSLAEVTKYFSRDYEEFSMIHEGKTAIISLSQDPKDGSDYRDYYRLKTNGLNESIYNKKNLDLVPKYEGLLGMLPFALAVKVDKAFVVGYGGGYTVDLLTKLAIPEVHVAELEEGIIKAAEYVYQGENPILKRPNLHLTLEDARFVMATKQGGPFDIILSQPSHSWLSGVANLFTQEFFEIVRGNLSDAGVFSQWLNLYNMDEKVLRSIMRTFFDTFPHGYVFTDHKDEELIMIGSMRPLKFDVKKLQMLTSDPGLVEDLVQLPFSSPEEFLSNFATTRDVVMKATEGAPINTDINAFAEVNQSALFYAAEESVGKPQNYLSKLYFGDLAEVVENYVGDKQSFFYDTLASLQKQAKFYKFDSIYGVYQKVITASAGDRLRAGYLAMRAQRYATAQTYFSDVMASSPDSVAMDYTLANLVETEAWARVIEFYEKNAAVAGDFSKCYYTEALLQMANKAAANQSSNNKVNLAACGSYGKKVAGKQHEAQRDFEKAVQAYEAFYAEYPHDVEVVERLTALHLLLGNSARGREFAEFLPKLHKDRLMQLGVLTDYYQSRGYIDDAAALLSLQRGSGS